MNYLFFLQEKYQSTPYSKKCSPHLKLPSMLRLYHERNILKKIYGKVKNKDPNNTANVRPMIQLDLDFSDKLDCMFLGLVTG